MRKYYSKKDISLTTQENFYLDRRDIEKWLKQMRITDYQIRSDGKVDCFGDVLIAFRRLRRIPVKFGVVSGSFDCSDNKLTSLEGSPDEVGGSFSCEYNKLTSLEGGPKTVEGDYTCHVNRLLSLTGVPEVIYGVFYCDYNPLVSLKGGPKVVHNTYSCSNCALQTLDGAPVYVGWDFYCYGNSNLSSDYLNKFDFSFVTKKVKIKEPVS